MTTNERIRARRTIMGCAALTALVLCAALAGCEGGEPADVQSYTDSAGRSCSVDLADISLTATCDADPTALVSCEAGQEAAFVLYDDYDFDTMIYTRQSCAACVDRASHQTFVSDSCATVECTTDDDCLNRDGDTRPFACSSGICLRS